MCLRVATGGSVCSWRMCVCVHVCACTYIWQEGVCVDGGEVCVCVAAGGSVLMEKGCMCYVLVQDGMCFQMGVYGCSC